MTLAYPIEAFQPARLMRRPGGKGPVRSRKERAAGIAVAMAAHLLLAAGLLFGIEAARAPATQAPIIIDILPERKKPEIKPVAAPKFVPPVNVSVPPPLIDIAPPPPANAVTAMPALAPAPPQPPLAAPAQADAPAWNGQASYFASLLAWLDRFKQYPPAARAAHIEGQVFVHFVMRRDGTVQSAEIAKSSGRPALDREALAMIRRAGKLPAMPTQMKGDVLDGIIGPIAFSLR